MHKYYLPGYMAASATTSLTTAPPPPRLFFLVRPLFAIMLIVLFVATLGLWSSSSANAAVKAGEDLASESSTSSFSWMKRIPLVSKISPYGILVLAAGVALTKTAERMTRSTYRGFTREEVTRHNNSESCWLLVNDEVFDVTHFVPKHPPGAKLILNQAGKDATRFYNFHLESTKHFWKQNKIGWIIGGRSDEEVVEGTA